MRQNRVATVVIIALVALILGFINLSPETKNKIAPFLPGSIKDSKINLGLDLQGGAHLDYKLDMRKVPEMDRESIIDGVLQVITKRVNSLGVSEPNIYTSSVADETHIIVELAGIHDLEKAKEIVGKTIQLEFKEQKTQLDENEKTKILTQATSLLDKVKKGGDMELIGKEEQQAYPGKVKYEKQEEFTTFAEFDQPTIDKIKKIKPGQISGELIEAVGAYHIIKINEKTEEDKEVTTDKKAQVSHILIAYSGAERAGEEIKRTQEEATARAEEVLKKATAADSDFSSLAKEYSDDISKEEGGKLPEPVVEGGAYDPTFASAALELKKDEVSPAVLTPFGYHIIKANEVTEAKTETVKESRFKYQRILVSTAPDPWKETPLTGKHFVHADVDFGGNGINPEVVIRFNDEGGKLFEEITGRNVNKPVAIFVGGEMISSPIVQTKISGGQARITGNFTMKEAQELARDLNTGAIPAPIVLSGQRTIGSTLGQEALTTSLWAGLIGLILVAIYMLIFYRLPGLLAVVALTIYAAFLLFLIKIALPLAVSLLIATGIFIWIIIKIVNSQDNGWEKMVSLIMAGFGLFFLSFLLSSPIVLTLAGVAGVILSIGMAVDANILIFERVKEELKAGRPYSSAIELGFDRAWSSIRDSNFSSLITCGILFYFGSSIIQGFAFNLAAGIVVSMLTAITITRSFMRALVGTEISKNMTFMGVNMNKVSSELYKIIENTKNWFTLSGAMVLVSIIALVTFGLNLGIDFTGGTLMELKFEKEISKDDLAKGFMEIESKLKAEMNSGKEKTTGEKPSAWIDTAHAQGIETAVTPAEATEATDETPAKTADKSLTTASISAVEEDIVDFGNPVIIFSNEGYIIKLKYLSQKVHDNLKKELEAKFGKFEETRFTTVGPTIGETMKYRAVTALLIAIIAIVCYIAFAFRGIPKELGYWRFGVSAIIALIHDVLIATGAFAIFGHYFNVEIDALFITALLTIMGFSIHDTIVVFDRIRENLRTRTSRETFDKTTNKALTQTMARSINTSVSTLITLGALYFLGSESIEWFVLILIIGIFVGTYSSICVASPILVAWNKMTNKNRPQ